MIDQEPKLFLIDGAEEFIGLAVSELNHAGADRPKGVHIAFVGATRPFEHGGDSHRLTQTARGVSRGSRTRRAEHVGPREDRDQSVGHYSEAIAVRSNDFAVLRRDLGARPGPRAAWRVAPDLEVDHVSMSAYVERTPLQTGDGRRAYSASTSRRSARRLPASAVPRATIEIPRRRA